MSEIEKIAYGETSDVERVREADADFEGHRFRGGAPSDDKAATDDDSADFEGHRMSDAKVEPKFVDRRSE